jgi:hypothetical protein
VIKLKKNERLVFAGNAMLRGPDGKILQNVPQYMIVNADEADPEAVVAVKKNQRVILAGEVFNDLQAARERFDAAEKAGRRPSPPPLKEKGIPLYILEDEENVDPKTGLTHEEQRAIKALTKDLLAVFAAQMRE